MKNLINNIKLESKTLAAYTEEELMQKLKKLKNAVKKKDLITSSSIGLH